MLNIDAVCSFPTVHSMSYGQLPVIAGYMEGLPLILPADMSPDGNFLSSPKRLDLRTLSSLSVVKPELNWSGQVPARHCGDGTIIWGNKFNCPASCTGLPSFRLVREGFLVYCLANVDAPVDLRVYLSGCKLTCVCGHRWPTCMPPCTHTSWA